MKSIKQVTRFRLVIAFFTLFAVTGCGSQSSPPSSLSQSAGAPPGVTARVFVGNTNGTISVIDHGNGGSDLSKSIDVFSSAGDMVSSTKNHIFVNMGSTNQVAALDPVGETATFRKFIPVGQRPVHIYRDPEGTRIWVLNDADPTTGVDTITSECNSQQAGSVSVIQNHGTAGHGDDGEESNAGEVLKTICVGKGHHKAAFSTPTTTDPSIPHRAFISNITDGTITVIDNDPSSDNYLTVIGTIDLCDSNKESCPAGQGGAGPHGMYFSSVNGKIYNNNENHGTVNVINPTSLAIEATVDIGFAGATHITPDGRFVIVRGVDRTSDPTRVTGKITIFDATDPSNNFTTINLPDVNPGALAFTSIGTMKKMYVASAATGNDDQRASQKSNVVQVFDITALPADPTLIKEIGVGSTTGGRSIGIHEHDKEAENVFVTNRADGTVSVIDAQNDTAIDTLQVGGTPTSLLVFSMEGDLSH